MTHEQAPDRTVLEITGSERESFLQGLVTTDVARARDGLVYTALLTPQGKYLVDFFLVPHGEALLLDVKSDFAEGLLKRLTLYKLRADVAIARAALNVHRGVDAAPADAFADPRDPSMGWRRYTPEPGPEPQIDWDARRVAACIPETGIELIPDQSFILEAGFDRLGGVDHRKGCYVGQEVTARMRHKTELRKGLVTVTVEGAAPVGTPITTADGRAAGTLYTQAGGQGIAHLRYERAGAGMRAGDAAVHWQDAAARSA